jgi:hypothetical protein
MRFDATSEAIAGGLATPQRARRNQVFLKGGV